jgi:hypothetical protein
LLVNNAIVVPSVCDACGAAFVFTLKGESVLTASASDRSGQIQCYCANCADRLWIPTLAGCALRHYSMDWAIPLRRSRNAQVRDPLATP